MINQQIQIKEIKQFHGLKIEKIGFWLWISGNTYPIKEKLKQMGFFYSKNKRAWFYNGEDKKKGKGFYKNLEELKNKFGCEEIF